MPEFLFDPGSGLRSSFSDPCRPRRTSAARWGQACSWSSCLKTQLFFTKIVLRNFLKNNFGCRLDVFDFKTKEVKSGSKENIGDDRKMSIHGLKCIIVIPCFWLRRFISVGLFILFRINMFSPFFGQFMIELN